MGTRSLVEVLDGNEILMTMYQQFDGYPEGVGAHLARRFGDTKIVNGFTSQDSGNANGMRCLAAQIVAEFKDGIGNVYLERPGERDLGEEYIYVLRERNEKIWLDLYEGAMTAFGFSSEGENRPETRAAIYSGFLDEYKEWLKTYES